MLQKLLSFLGRGTFSSLRLCLQFPDALIFSVLSFYVTTPLAVFVSLPSRAPSHQCRRWHDVQTEEDESCCPETKCAVCLEDLFCDFGNQVALPGCGHLFHRDCINKWLDCSSSCPMCRAKMKWESRKGLLHCLWRFLLGCLFRWMDRWFDSQLTLAFCGQCSLDEDSH
ncbi:hypothetical protein MLD38_007136 [Melastoma candidum]|uniref:Uncharacterized protein n=1 Tax=Melastoma candidum TaxID=119954 RepID=A0ACB9RUD7_9MYRT|nr:hypothetical protein MLD38_007136 [Melastoma candidum]